MKEEITIQQGFDAQTKVREYYAWTKRDPDNIDWDNKPDNLPQEISEAWDTYLKQQASLDDMVDY